MRHLPTFSRQRHILKFSLPLAAMLAFSSPSLAHDTETANKKVVLGFYQALDDADAAGATSARIQSIAETYLSADYVQHAEAFARLPGAGSARDKLIRMFQTMPAMKLPPARTVAIMAENDLVMLLTARDMPNPAGGTAPAYIFNMFRVRDGRLVEHWDVSPPPPGLGAASSSPPGPVPSGGLPSDAVPPPVSPR
ncbi:nuclear transport factor 2 family protein [Sphingobium sp. 3R8]|uniref:nuclear transport factor 2 family protein n=1 Tax=Sphingobium sp. 3R8 TaxID=2874921 RepID=UPI001CCE3FBD|nr:nuclear transport factor 2 family protein [Sphingobium sp. 3R8]MBZ9649754.1 nuclear transport factor 2 family protein [Sphingobium sp. 3R8]